MAIMRTLLILRHAKSDWHAGAGNDFDRPLSRRGRHDGLRMGKWMQSRDLIPEAIISSPAKRTRQTVKRICQELCPDMENIILDESLYLANLHDLLVALRYCPDQVTTLLLIGHNPGLEELLLYLAGKSVPEPADGKLLPTATLAELRLEAGWNDLLPGSAHLVAITRPKNLPD